MNLVVLVGLIAAGAAIVAGSEQQWVLEAMLGGSLVFGVLLFVLPIGGADYAGRNLAPERVHGPGRGRRPASSSARTC